MRTKKTYIVLSFRTTVEAMAWEEALRHGTDPRAADPAPTGDLCRVRPCLAHDAGGLGTLEQPAGPGGLRRGVAGGAMTNRRTFYERIG